MSKVKHGLHWLWPLAVAGVPAVIASAGFRHFLEHHPAVAAVVPIAAAVIHQLDAQRRNVP